LSTEIRIPVFNKENSSTQLPIQAAPSSHGKQT